MTDTSAILDAVLAVCRAASDLSDKQLHEESVEATLDVIEAADQLDAALDRFPLENLLAHLAELDGERVRQEMPKP